MEYLDSVAARYGVLPSRVVGEENPFKALAIDVRAHNCGVERENKEAWEARIRAKHGR